MDKITQKILFLEKALTSLEDMIKEPVGKKRAEIDSSIQRFEYTFELCWKTIQVILESKGLNVNYPKDVLKAAYKGEIITHDKLWLSMLADRNETPHAYDMNVADRIYKDIKNTYFPELQKTVLYLKNSYSKN